MARAEAVTPDREQPEVILTNEDSLGDLRARYRELVQQYVNCAQQLKEAQDRIAEVEAGSEELETLRHENATLLDQIGQMDEVLDRESQVTKAMERIAEELAADLEKATAKIEALELDREPYAAHRAVRNSIARNRLHKLDALVEAAARWAGEPARARLSDRERALVDAVRAVLEET